MKLQDARIGSIVRHYGLEWRVIAQSVDYTDGHRYTALRVGEKTVWRFGDHDCTVISQPGR